MIPFLMALSCLTNITKDCTHPTPIMNYQLKHIWSPTNPFFAKAMENGTWTTTRKPPDMRALRGQKLKVAIIEDEPFVTQRFGNNTVLGIARTMLNVLKEALGFDWEFVWPDDNAVGIYNASTGTHTGIVDMLVKGKANFSINFMSMIEERSEVLDFSRPFGEERWVVMMIRPQETTDGDGLVAPFQTEVWYYLLVSLVLMGPVIYGMIKFRCRLCKGHPTLSVYYSLGDCIWFVYGALMKQGSVLKPIADSTRVLMATWWIFVTVLTAFYTANLTAYLTLSKIPIPYDSLTKIGYRDYWVARAGDTLEAVIRARPTPRTANVSYAIETVRYEEFKKLRYKLGGYGLFLSNTTDMVEKVRREKYLLLDEQSRVERIIYKDFRAQSKLHTPLHQRCAFIMSRNPIFRVPYGFAFPKNSTIKPIFDPILDKLAKAGLFNYWRRKDLPMKDPCSADSDFRERQLRNGDLMTTYILCGCGYLLAVASFLFEVIVKFVTGRKMQGQLVPADKTNPLSFYKGNLAVPAGAPTFFDTEKFLKNINGRDYVVMKMPDGRTRLVPKNDGNVQPLQLQPAYNPTPPISYNFMS